jgi:S-adenosylmethionine:tRNA ribosyltransferase-isomerase
MRLSDFHFTLPDQLIARYPLKERSASRLLCLHQNSPEFQHQEFTHIVNLLKAGDLLIFNNTKVLPARVCGKKSTGGRIEMLLERILSPNQILAQLRASKSPRIGEKCYFGEYIFEVRGRLGQFYELRHGGNIIQVLESIGKIPIPPYLQRESEDIDIERYQTVYAKTPGSVAAPTAGLHFDDNLLQQLANKQVDMGELTLHIGAGTFLPVRTESILDHQMHAEYFEISTELCSKINAARARGGRVIAVGTTSLRALETASLDGEIKPYAGETKIFIYPGFTFRCVDVLITNLHLSGSSLLMLVSAFGGHEKIMRAYEEAVREQYRFYSYGDAMWIEKGI